MNKRILIIDDDEDILEMLSIVFLTSPFDISLSSSGLTGNEISRIHPDLILLDVQIKGYRFTGDQICKEIKSLPEFAKTPVFLLSAEPDLNLLAEACAADGYMAKPLDLIALKKVIHDKLML